MKKQGQFHPPGTVVVHPFGRFCNGYKSAGGRDVIDVTGILTREKRIDSRRTVLAGFSMGGAGAWLLGAAIFLGVLPAAWSAAFIFSTSATGIPLSFSA